MATLSRHTITLFNHISRREATGEGGLITGTDPTAFTTSDPLRLWIIQVGIIIIMAQLLSLGLRRMRQPKVIAEVLGGILLGPTAFGRIPGFTKHIFPSVSLPYLSLVANIGLCLFLFLVGLEIDTSIIKRNARMSVMVSFAGIALPFSFGSALAVPLYHHFIDPSIHFTYFMLFSGVAYSITAFPILCRILTELRLLDTSIGIVVLSAGVGNDIAGWTLLALSVALVNAGSGLSALWILLVCIAFTLFLLIPGRFVLLWLARKTRSTENGPTMFYMTVVIILVWASAFFTDSIGVNAIFGAFLAGLIVPREGGLAIALTEKLEDMVSIVFLPLYFTLSGLNTDLGLLNNGITWAFTIAIIALAFFGKFGGCTFASRVAGFSWRESSTIGALMSCKGLVELIVLNVGLQAGILSQRVFSMFVLQALVLTFITTPLVSVLYPPECRVRAGETSSHKRGDETGRQGDKASITHDEDPSWRRRFTVVLDKLEHVPTAMSLTQLVVTPCNTPSPSDLSTTATADSMEKLSMPDISVEALQLIELSDRTSAVMKSSVADSSLHHMDPVLGIFRTFGELNDLAVTTSLSVVPYDDFAESVSDHAQRHGSHLVLLPWVPAPTQGPVVDVPDKDGDDGTASKAGKNDYYNPFDVLFGSTAASKADRSHSAVHCQFIRGVFARSKTDVALFIDTGNQSSLKGPVHVFLPFSGGPDDRLALELVVQLCLNPKITATVVRMVKRDDAVDGGDGHSIARYLEDKLDASWPTTELVTPLPGIEGPSVHSTIPDTVYGQPTTQTRLQSETADSICWTKYTTTQYSDGSSAVLRQALSRIHFSDMHTPTPVHAAIRHARGIRERSTPPSLSASFTSDPRLLIVAGRSRRLAKESHRVEMKRFVEMYHGVGGVEGMRRTIGDIGAAMFVGVGALASAIVVVQAVVDQQ